MPEEISSPETRDDVLYRRMKAVQELVLAGKIGVPVADNEGNPIPLTQRMRTVVESSLGVEVRRRAKTDLFFLATKVLDHKYGAFLESLHRPVCDFFVKKDPTKSIAEQDTVKERLLLWPRGAFKTSADEADIVQWVLCFPNIRIFILSAGRKMPIGILDNVKDCFIIQENSLTMMNIFFPDYCVEAKDAGNQTSFVCPLRTVKRREPTIMASSIESTNVGYHFEVMKIDDAVSPENSTTPDQLEKVISGFNINRKVREPFGYIDIIGTRYDPLDLYGFLIDKNVFGKLKVMCSPAMTPKDPKADVDTLMSAPKEEDWDILFPVDAQGTPRLTFSNLMYEYHLDEEQFWGQYMLKPRSKRHIEIPRELLLKHTCKHTELPYNGPIVIIWDLAYSTKRGRDFTTGAVGMFDDKARLFIIDLVRGRFGPYDLAKQIVSLYAAWPQCQLVAIEDNVGTQWLRPGLEQAAKEAGLPAMFPIDFFPADQQKDAKHNRMAALESWLKHDALYFAAHLPHLEILYSEFEKCLGQHHHDDIPDVISQFPRYAPRMQMWIAKEEIHTFSREDAEYNLLYEEGCDAYGRIGFGFPEPPPQVELEEDLRGQSQTPGLPSILGYGVCG